MAARLQAKIRTQGSAAGAKPERGGHGGWRWRRRGLGSMQGGWEDVVEHPKLVVMPVYSDYVCIVWRCQVLQNGKHGGRGR